LASYQTRHSPIELDVLIAHTHYARKTQKIVHRVHQKVSQKVFAITFKIVRKFPSNLTVSCSS